MQNKINTNVEHIIAKIDNDFNPDNSDWIPRVVVWTIEAMNMIDVLRTKKVKKKVSVKDNIAYLPCNVDAGTFIVYDNRGCKIKEANDESGCGCSSFTGEVSKTNAESATDTTGIIKQQYGGSTYVKADTINDKEWPGRYNVVGYRQSDDINRSYTYVDCNKLELNFDTDYIVIEYDGIETYESKKFGCELPVIPNNAILLEYIAYYCMYKMLCRGYTHPVFNLAASQYGTNPYYIANQLRDEAKRDVINRGFNADDASKLFRSTFFIETFDTRQ